MTEPTRPASPPKTEARAYNAFIGTKIEEKIVAARALLQEATALAQSVVADVEDISKESISEAIAEVGRFLHNVDLLQFRSNERKDRLRQKVAELRAQAEGAQVP